MVRADAGEHSTNGVIAGHSAQDMPQRLCAPPLLYRLSTSGKSRMRGNEIELMPPVSGYVWWKGGGRGCHKGWWRAV